jgi:uncharacterized protein YdbL (DUF1318 family)
MMRKRPDKPIVIELNINIKQEVVDIALLGCQPDDPQQQQGHFLRWHVHSKSSALKVAAAFAVAGMNPPPRWRSATRHGAPPRAAGQVGEKVDGYLGYVVPPSPSLKAVIDELNIKRKAVYAEKKPAADATVEEYALTPAASLIRPQTQPGEKYQGPGTTWKTRTSGALAAISRLP